MVKAGFFISESQKMARSAMPCLLGQGKAHLSVLDFEHEGCGYSLYLKKHQAFKAVAIVML